MPKYSRICTTRLQDKIAKRSLETNDKTDKYISPATVKLVECGTQNEEDRMGQGVSTETEDKATQIDWL